MKFPHLLVLFTASLVLSACSTFYGNQSAPDPAVHSPKPLSIPLGKNWEIIEEAPELSDGRRLPFQTEQSVRPEVIHPVSPADKRKIETTR